MRLRTVVFGTESPSGYPPHATPVMTSQGASPAPTSIRTIASWTLPLMAVALAMSSSFRPAQAQVPGYPQLNPGAVKAEYLAEVLERLNELMADWGSSWAEDRIDDLARLYAEEAILIPPDGPLIRGQTEIREYFDDVLAEHGHIEAFMLDFDASGEMAQVFGNYLLGFQQGDEAGSQKSGPMLTVYVRRGRRWMIRSQIFVPTTSPN